MKEAEGGGGRSLFEYVVNVERFKKLNHCLQAARVNVLDIKSVK